MRLSLVSILLLLRLVAADVTGIANKYAVHLGPTPWTVGKVVKTSSGAAKGHAALLPGAVDVSEYLGIRFGQDTAGRNRFFPAKKYTSDAAFDAAAFGPGCPAPPVVLPGAPPTANLTQSEDCLFVNVWTKPQVGEKNKAVMVWIFGGGFTFGDSATPIYNGAKLAQNQDVVVVSLNYRTNIFGFPGCTKGRAPDIPELNLGLIDQRLAVKWVYENVAGFGGNPDRITIFGESAGGSSVDYYAYAWLNNPLVQGFITESGTAMITGPFAPKFASERAKAWFNMTTALGCGGIDDGTAALRCAQNKTYQQIQAATPQAGGKGFNAIVGLFGPTYDHTVYRDVFLRASKGNFVQKPLLTGSNQNESLIFSSIPPPASPQEDLAIQNGFRCGAANAAKARFINGVPVWRYHYAGTTPGSNVGAVHGQDVPLVFDGTTGLSKVFQDGWGSFARDPVYGLTRYGWPKYNPDHNTLIRLGYNGAVQPDFVAANTYDGQYSSVVQTGNGSRDVVGVCQATYNTMIHPRTTENRIENQAGGHNA